jgi:hypothetical protein
LEWGYKEGDADEQGIIAGDWTVVDKSILESDDVPDNVEKMIGFEGKPDPNSGKCSLVTTFKALFVFVGGGVFVQSLCSFLHCCPSLLCALTFDFLFIFYLCCLLVEWIIRLLLCLQ